MFSILLFVRTPVWVGHTPCFGTLVSGGSCISHKQSLHVHIGFSDSMRRGGPVPCTPPPPCPVPVPFPVPFPAPFPSPFPEPFLVLVPLRPCAVSVAVNAFSWACNVAIVVGGDCAAILSQQRERGGEQHDSTRRNRDTNRGGWGQPEGRRRVRQKHWPAQNARV